ncbi:hypothetical protein [Tumebacillus flagellatus]|uniref:Uncharacterized protein n=1 Tax=Tumebacillus flagellatus TaxID=1157490 RepID=A0A074LJR8_9BACL|nr:hypothetical protein [Tumebacillus flagellatus]KEO80850.1 hypothetical protein EL26_24015 [Tumebacillus flagellatus]
MAKNAQPAKPSKKVQNAWKTIAEYMLETDGYFARSEHDHGEPRFEPRREPGKLRIDVMVVPHIMKLTMSHLHSDEQTVLECTIEKENT